MITSTSNEKVKKIAKLLTSAKTRREEGLFVVEGERIVREIPRDRIKECFVSESFAGRFSLPDDIAIELVSDAVMKKMSGTMNPQGVLCLVKIDEENLDTFINNHDKGDFKVLVLENLQDPGNIGTMIRTAEGAGFNCIIADNRTVDIYNPKVTRSTMGSLFRVPVMYTDDLPSAVNKLKNNCVRVFAAHLNGECDYSEARYGNRAAILIGNEGNGLSDEISSLSDTLVRIPMSGKVESLNAAVAAALMMYEVRRK